MMNKGISSDFLQGRARAHAQKSENNKLLSGLFDDIVPIPDCADAIELYGMKMGLNTPSKMAYEMLKEAKEWQKLNPDKDVLEIITPDWQDYVRANL